MKQFEVGKTYWARATGKYAGVYRFKVITRDTETLMFEDISDAYLGGTRHRQIFVKGGVEQFWPFGESVKSLSVDAAHEDGVRDASPGTVHAR